MGFPTVIGCDYPGCVLDGVCGFLKRDEDARETESITRIAGLRPVGLTARPQLRRISIEEAAAFQVMES